MNSPVWVRTPPKKYGGIELVVALLVDELVKQGHEVDLFATGDSNTDGELHSVYDLPQTPIGHSMPDSLHSSQVYQRADEYDIIHDHTGPIGVAFASICGSKTPVLSTLHGDFNIKAKFFFSHFMNSVHYNPISDFQRDAFPELKYVNTVYNAIDLKKYKYQEKKEDFFLFVSRFTEAKAPHLAIEAAKTMGERLVMAGKIDPGVDMEYFKTQIEPYVDGDQIKFLGEVEEEQKLELFAQAKAFLFPIQWAEPFGLVMAESIACGTPVVAWRNGAAPEVIQHGQTGFIVDSMREFIEAAGKINEIDPKVCRKTAEARFSPDRMAKDYAERYETVLSSDIS